MPLQLEVFRIHDDALMPYRGTVNSVGLDVHAYLKTETGRPNNMMIPPRSTRKIPTGLRMIPPPGHAIFMCSRSGMALKSLFVTNAPGVIDPDYRGEIAVLLYNGSFETHYVQHEERVGQIVVLPCIVMPVIELKSIDLDTSRGEAGWGSTGR